MSQDAKQPSYDADKNCWFMAYPMFGIASAENGKHLISCGGGGSAGKKEIPNEVHLHEYDAETNSFVTKDRMNLGATLPTKVTYSPQQDLWCVSAGPIGYVIEINGDQMNMVHQFTSEFEKKPPFRPGMEPEDPTQEICMLTSNMLVTGGSDKVVRLWGYPDVSKTPRMECRGHEKEIQALDVNDDESLIVTTSEDNTVRVWQCSDGKEVAKIQWKHEGEVLSPKHPQFFNSKTVLIAAAGPRGPARIGLWTFGGATPQRVFEATMDPKPCSALKLNQSKTMMCAGFVPGHKIVYHVDIPAFEQGGPPFQRAAVCGSAKKPLHGLQVQVTAFLDSESGISVSGDRSLHFGPMKILSGAKKGSVGGPLGCLFLLFLLIVGLLGGGGYGVYLTNQMDMAQIHEWGQWVDKRADKLETRLDKLKLEVEREQDEERPDNDEL